MAGMKCPKCNATVMCPKCNYMIPEHGISSSSNTVTILTKRKLTFEIGEGERKMKFTVFEPSAKQRDEYFELVSELGRIQAEKQMAIAQLARKVSKFSDEDHTEEEWKAFRKEVDEETARINEMPNVDQRKQVEFFLGKIDDEMWESEFTPSIRNKIISDCENILCDMEELGKNMDNLLRQIKEMSQVQFLKK